MASAMQLLLREIYADHLSLRCQYRFIDQSGLRAVQFGAASKLLDKMHLA